MPSSPYFTYYQQNLKNNGIANSNGYPQNLRKIAITNGSLTGKQEANPGQRVLDMRGYIDMSFWFLFWEIKWRINTFRSVNNYMYPTGQSGQIFDTAAAAISWSPYTSQSISMKNMNPRGSLDVVSGGLYNSVNDYKEEIIASLYKQGQRRDMRIPSSEGGIVVPHSFISTHSALDTSGFTNWHQPINKNLVCSGQTPFNNYFGEQVNREHIFFTPESINWLFAELDQQPQPPSVYSNPNLAIDGLSSICINQPETYKFNQCDFPATPQFSVVNGNIIGQSSTSVTVQPTSGGTMSIIANFPNTSFNPVIKNITVNDGPSFTLSKQGVGDGVYLLRNGNDNEEYEYIEWIKMGSNNADAYIPNKYSKTTSIWAWGSRDYWSISFKVIVKNKCGEKFDFFTLSNSPKGGDRSTYAIDNMGNNTYKITLNNTYANYRSAQVLNNKFKISVFNFLMNEVHTTNKGTFDLSFLPKGNYIIKAIIDDAEVISRNIIIQ